MVTRPFRRIRPMIWWCLLVSLRVAAQPLPEAVSPLTNGSFSISSPDQLAPWQQRLTLGAGDILTISIYERPEYTKPNVTIAPDGRINYLQARDVVAAGLTVDDLREALQNVLLKSYRPPLRVIVIPQAYNSKKYYMLGNVSQKGVFRMETPITLLEAVARAQGFLTATPGDNSTLLVDLSRSFLMRKFETNAFAPLPVDFERLFVHGDLAQNVALAPDDYLYFSPATQREVYVLGEVGKAGAVPFRSGLTVVGAIASQGGFTDRAYRKRILIVRGSLHRPTTYALDVADVLAAKSLDFRLEARDIIYVSRKPWYKVEELLEAAVTDFMRAAVITWTGANVGPWITDPIIR